MKLFVTDADGTITFDNHEVADDLCKKINDLDGHQDVIKVLATGRNINPANYILKKNGIDFDYYILSNGAIITDRNFNIIYSRPLKGDLETIVEAFANHYRIDTKDDHFFTQSYRESTNFPVEKVNIINSYKQINEEIYVISSRMESQKEIDKLKKDVDLEQFQVIQNNLDLDISAKHTDKYNAISKLIEIEELEDIKIYAIGDSFNDYNMIKYSDVGATFNTAPDKLKLNCDVIVADSKEFIEYMLNN